ncbi:MAG: response regulator [Elusimicrobiales bacterium]
MARILIIDDDQNVRSLLSEIFLALDPKHEIFTAVDGLEGVLLAKKELPDVIITDVDMPNMNGYGVCRQLRMDPRTMKTPILMLTGQNDLAGAIEGMNCGADDHITKPFNVDEVAARLQALLLRGK